MKRTARRGGSSRRGSVGCVCLLTAALLVFAPALPIPGQEPATEPIVVASKPFAESYLLAEMFAQLLEDRGFRVDRRLGLGATELAFQGLRTGAVDVYPEYTGTGLLAILGEEPAGASSEVFQRVSREFYEQWGILWLPPLGFENSYAIAVRPETAERLGLSTISDLARLGEELVGGFSPDFIGRADGLPGLAERYGLSLGDVRSLLQAVKYQALESEEVDVIDGYSTDGAIARLELTVLSDDLGFFPPYDAAPLVSRELSERAPRAVAILAELSGRIDVADMREWNRRIEVDEDPVANVASEALEGLGLIGSSTQGAGRDMASRGERSQVLALIRQTITLTIRHLWLVSGSLFAAILVALPLGLLLERRRDVAETVVRAVGTLQTVPSIALLAFMIPILGIGVGPALVALFLYSLFPIVRSTYSGVRDADPAAVDSAAALGMTQAQVTRLVRLPLATPFIMSGIRTAAVINVGTATLAAFVGAGGLGDPIVSGLALADSSMILSGAIPAALLALVVDWALGRVESGLTPRGLVVERA